MTTAPDRATTTDPWALLEQSSTVLAVHAHPDDESLATGPLLAHLSAIGVRVALVTATRGEEGEVVPGALAADDDRPLDEVRATEIDTACRELGIAERHLLGTAPALTAGIAARRYRDSGMQWVREGVAGPSDTAGPDSFTHRPQEQAVADLTALITQLRPDAVLGYDDAGTYGHPDHVHAHHVTVAACRGTGTPLVEFASAQDAEGFVWRELADGLEATRRALECYRTQLTVLGADAAGVRVRHVGGQDDLVPPRTGLRLVQD